MRTLLCALVAVACVCIPALTQSKPDVKTEQGQEKKAESPKAVPLKVNAEANMLLRAMRDKARDHHKKTGKIPLSLSKDVGVEAASLSGNKFTVADTVYSSEKSGALVAEPKDAANGIHIIKFDWTSGKGDTQAYTSLKELQDAHPEFEWSGGKGVAKVEDKVARTPEEQWDALYRVGATWTEKIKSGGGTWQKYEVLAVKDGVASMSMIVRFGADGKWEAPQEYKAKRDAFVEKAKNFDSEMKEWGYKITGRGEELVGDWDCSYVDLERGRIKLRKYFHKEYGLDVKTIEDGRVHSEVVELKPVSN